MNSFCEAVENYCDEAGYSYYKDYSGRGMFGESCIGIDVASGDSLTMLIGLCDYLTDCGFAPVSDIISSVCSDSMGMGTIVYFPGIVDTRDDESEEE